MSPGEDGLIGIPFPEHSNELLCHLNDQRRTGLLCDLTLTSRGARYPTHRSVMAAVSLYFRRLFGTEEGGGEGGTGFSVCQLDCVAPDALDALLEFAYTATLTIPSSGMRDVLRGAQLLGIQCVADACREILGETDETEAPVEEYRVQQTPPQKRLVNESTEKISRRKTDKKKVKKLSSNHTSVISPPSPMSHPSPASDSLRSLPSTQPPSPERDEHQLKSALNGDQRTTHDPVRGTTLNGGLLHWLQDHSARPSPVPRSNDKLSEEEDTEGFVEDGVLIKNTSIPTSLTHREAVASAAGGGRKRKSQTPQQCPVCQKIIHGAGKLPRHMRTHTGEKPFQCSACGVRFTRNDKLKIHMRKHTGERPYPCPHCPARFLHSYDLKNHLSLHSGARPFECPLCHKAFAREDHLQRHRKGHSCLEVRTRRPRRGLEDEEVSGDGKEPSASLESLSLQAHTSGFLPSSVLESGNGPGTGTPLMYQDETERERSIALQALAQLAPHRLAEYPALFLRGLELRAREDHSRKLHSLASQRERWADNVEEDVVDDDVEEG